MIELRGIIPYLPSPVKENGRVDKDTLFCLSESLIEDGVHGLCVFGSVGEFAYLTRQQKTDIVKTVVQAAGKRVPVVAGVSGFSSYQLVEEALLFRTLGVDAIVVLPSVYFMLNDDELVALYRAVAVAVPDLPIVVYSNPKFMHFDLSLAFFRKISDIHNILYYKDASGNTGKLLSLVNEFGNRYKLFSASAHIPLFVSMIGGVGWMAGPACLAPKQAVRLYNLIEEEKFDEALDLQKKLWEVNRVFAKYSLVTCVKYGLEHLGFPVGSPIALKRPLLDSEKAEIASVIDEIRSL